MAIKREFALLSAYNKEGLDSMAQAFVSSGLELLATGNTRAYLQEKGFSVEDVSSLTGEPERFGGRLKTLHHKILGAILLRPGPDESEWPFDFRIAAVLCNFYPFVEKAASSSTMKELIEWIDIGGPTMVRAAAKNYHHVWVFTRTGHYTRFIATPPDEMLRARQRLSLEAFEDVAMLDEAIVKELGRRYEHELPNPQLVYGENPHQQAEFNAARDRQLKVFGKLSFNNIRDAEAALRFVLPFQSPAVSVVKHQTLCGAAAGCEGVLGGDVFTQAWESDPVSRFGGVLGFNFIPDETTTGVLKKKFVEVLVLPRSPGAESWASQFVEANQKARVVLVNSGLFGKAATHKEVFGGLLGTLVQESDSFDTSGSAKDFKKLTQDFGVWASSCSKSNAMILVDADEKQKIVTLAGSGQGQPNRVDALRVLALPRALEYAQRRERRLADMICFSDGFIPFTDAVQVLGDAGVKRLVQPGGSKADSEVAAACERLGIEMTITGRRHFWH